MLELLKNNENKLAGECHKLLELASKSDRLKDTGSAEKNCSMNRQRDITQTLMDQDKIKTSVGQHKMSPTRVAAQIESSEIASRRLPPHAQKKFQTFLEHRYSSGFHDRNLGTSDFNRIYGTYLAIVGTTDLPVAGPQKERGWRSMQRFIVSLWDAGFPKKSIAEMLSRTGYEGSAQEAVGDVILDAVRGEALPAPSTSNSEELKSFTQRVCRTLKKLEVSPEAIEFFRDKLPPQFAFMKARRIRDLIRIAADLICACVKDPKPTFQDDLEHLLKMGDMLLSGPCAALYEVALFDR